MRCSVCGGDSLLKSAQSDTWVCTNCGEHIKDCDIAIKSDSGKREASRSSNVSRRLGKLRRSWIGRLLNFSCVGRKIKTSAKWLCWIGVAIIWLVCVTDSLHFIFSYHMYRAALKRLLIAAAASVALWILCLFVYAFGNLIENDDKRTKAQQEMADAMRRKSDD